MNIRTKLFALLVVGGLSLATAGTAAAFQVESDGSGALPAPAGLLAVDDLLMFGTNPAVDTCNTHPLGFETWTAYGHDGVYEEVYHNGSESTPEMLERAILESEGQDWTEIFGVAKQCAKAGGACVCAAISLWSGRAVFCAACCPAGTAPFCVCDGLYAYAACGCAAY